ncbi:serine/threonine-protein kinase SRPK1 [Angomonas deanei]|uniref:non-specific serine/threonine protein kinase n=1 Tax=Angomonas deanei TaxID=59799 RepID=A0A7G2CQH7_9TRYP|nr:serine/threonine-protein kinase SRPK1 [Angomonas deanei]CAD2221231.1 Protein kinase domain containing protein, putative [Angomonas deanei]|eukprot:EPY20195.1 serine/threonine-protein kinase SRPK1 [Angomonas deanei]
MIYGLRQNPDTATLMTSMRSVEAQQRTSPTGITLIDIACSPSSRRTSTVFEPRSSAQFSGCYCPSGVSSDRPERTGSSAKDSGTSTPAAQHENYTIVKELNSPVPAIPRFSTLVEEKEALMKHIERESLPHPRDTNSSEKGRESEFSPLRYGSVEPLSHTARPTGDAMSHSSFLSGSQELRSGEESPPLEGMDSLEREEVEEAEYEEFEEENASEQNFGEGGHLACVPGDSLFNRYTLIRQLGVGRSSRVWLAVDQEQCAVSRRQLIKELGEEEVRRLYNPREKPLFVAIKIFRCGETYSDCALYESGVLKYINEYIRVKSMQKRFTLNIGRSHRSSAAETPLRSSSNPTSPPRAKFGSNALDNSLTTNSSADRQLDAIISYHQRITCMKGYFSVDGEYGTHNCLVMDVVGAGVDAAINEAELKGLPLEIVSSILISALEGLSLLASINVIHTDIKPENLLFVDLEESIANEMRELQTAHLHTGPDSKLWGPSSGLRISVADYLRYQKENKLGELSKTINVNSYKVYVSDFGLSFVVPPVLRGGVDGLRELGMDDSVFELDPMEQVRLMTKAQEQQARQARPVSSFVRAGNRKSGNVESPPFQSITAAPSAAMDSSSTVRVERVSYLNVHNSSNHNPMTSDSSINSHEKEASPRFSQRNVAYTSSQCGSPLPVAMMPGGNIPDIAARSSSSVPREESPNRPLSALYSAVVAPPTELEKDILDRQNYKRGVTVQSREYRSPEILLGQHFLTSSDIWSIGCIAYELVTGKFLFDAHADYEEALAEANAQDAERRRLEGSNRSSRQFSGWFDKLKGKGNAANSTSEMISAPFDDPTGENTINALYYEEYEKDLDVIHLKSIMKVIGPPPPAHLFAEPVGVYVEHFFDAEGRFMFFEDDEAAACGVEDAAPCKRRSSLSTTENSLNSSTNVSWLRTDSATPSLGVSPASVSLHYAPPSTQVHRGNTRNCATPTPRWREIQQELEEKFESRDEAHQFEAFLSACLQWDPSQRADALTLLQSNWIQFRQR